MTFTKDDVQIIKTLLAQQKGEILEATDRKITTVQTNLERKITATTQVRDTFLKNELKREIQTSEDNLKKELSTMQVKLTTIEGKIDQLRAETSEAIGDLADKVATQNEVDEHTKRIEKLEHLQKTA